MRGYVLVGLTGSIGSGKSTVAEMMRSKGATILDADLLAREIVAPGSPTLEEIEKVFGNSVITPQGELDRRQLGLIVFSDPRKRAELEAISHPAILKLFKERVTEFEKTRTSDQRVLVYVIPLLFETNRERDFDIVMVVSSSKEASIKRIIARDNCSEELAEKKLSSQQPIEDKVKRADIVIDNNGTLSELENGVNAAWKKIKVAETDTGSR